MMQKKLIALAVASAALASSAALAQTNVTIYGSVDAGFAFRNDHLNDGVGSQKAIDSGMSAGNRLGFTGVEDLGNGLKAAFVLEAGFQADTGEHAQGGKLFGRQAYVGLVGSAGTFVAGRLYTPHYSLLSAIDPFKAGTVGQYRNVFASGVTLASNLGGENLFDPTRVDNTVAWISPTWAGFNVTAAYATNAIGQEGVENRGSAPLGTGDNRVLAVLPRYTNGPVDVGLSYHQIKSKDGGDLVDIKNWALGGTLDFNVVKLHAFYDQNKWNDVLDLNVDLKLKSWMLGVTVPFGKHAIQGSWNQSKLSSNVGALEGKSRQYALGYTYAFSKRTNIYAAYAAVKNQDGRKDNIDTAAVLLGPSYAGGFGGTAASVGDASNAGQGYQKGLQVGLKHTF